MKNIIDIAESTNPLDYYSVPNLPHFAWGDPNPVPLDRSVWVEEGPGFFAWLMERPVLLIVGGRESERTYHAAALMRYWIDRAKDRIPDNLRFYFDDAGSLLFELRRRDDESNLFNIAAYTKYLTMTEIHRIDRKDHAAMESIIRKRCNAGRFTVLTAERGLPNVESALQSLLEDQRVVKLA